MSGVACDERSAREWREGARILVRCDLRFQGVTRSVVVPGIWQWRHGLRCDTSRAVSVVSWDLASAGLAPNGVDLSENWGEIRVI